MANIRENKQKGKIFSYHFTTCLGRDAQGRQLRRYTTWTAPDGLTPAKRKKAAERAADAWEQEIKAEYQNSPKEVVEQPVAWHPEPRRDDFVSFVNDAWSLLRNKMSAAT